MISADMTTSTVVMAKGTKTVSLWESAGINKMYRKSNTEKLTSLFGKLSLVPSNDDLNRLSKAKLYWLVSWFVSSVQSPSCSRLEDPNQAVVNGTLRIHLNQGCGT